MNPSDLRMLAQDVGVPIQNISMENITEIKDAPQAQKKTSKHKKVVKIVEDRVFKGPYGGDDHKLVKNLRYAYVIQILEVALQLPEWLKGSLRWEYIGACNDNQYYLVAPNVGKHKNIPFELANTKIETNVKVIPRGEAVKRVSDIEGTGLLTENIKSATLQHLYLRFLLDIGDSGTHHVLLRKDYISTGRLIAGIDLEEMRGNIYKESRLAHLFKRAPSKRQKYLYESDICVIKSLSHGQLEQLTLDRLGAVEVDLERLKENMELWERLTK